MSSNSFDFSSHADNTLRKNTVAYFAQYLIYAAAFSIFMPYYVAAAVISLIGVTFCILPGTRDKIFVHKGSFILLLFTVMTVIVAIVYGNKVGLVRTGVFAMMAVVAFVARALANRRFYERLMNCLIIGAVLETVVCIVERIIHIKDEGYRCQALFTNPNFFGIAIAIAILICAYKAVTHAKHVYLYYIAAVFCAVSIYLCGSMSLWFVIFIGIFIMLVLNHEYKLLAIFMGVIACAAVVLLLIPGIITRLNEVSSTTGNRVKIWTFAIEQIKEAPIFGRGFFSYKFLYNTMKVARPEIYKAALCHNLLIESLLSFGVVGTLLIGTYMVAFFKTIFTCHDELKKRGRSYAVTTFIVALSVAIAFYGVIDTTVVWVQSGMMILFITAGIGVDERELRHVYHAERKARLNQEI